MCPQRPFVKSNATVRFPPISTNAALNTKVAQEFSAGSGHNVRKPCVNGGPKCPLLFRNGRNLARRTG